MIDADVEIVDMCKMCEFGKTYPSHGVRSYYEDGTLTLDIRNASQTMAALHTSEYYMSKYLEINKISIGKLGPARKYEDITNYRTKEKNYIFVPQDKEYVKITALLNGYNGFLYEEKEKGRKIDFPINVYFVEIDDNWRKRITNQNGLFEYGDLYFLSSKDASNTFNKKIRNAFGRAKKGDNNGVNIICPFEKVIL